MKRDSITKDLFAWEPPAVVRKFEEAEVRAASLRGRIAKAVAAALKETGKDRDQVAAEMSAYLAEEVTKNMLDAYASEAREDHTIPYLRLIALVQVTGDVRPLQIGAEPVGHSLVEDRYLAAIEDAMFDDKMEEMAQRRRMARRTWKGARP
ncbi:MAG: DNA transposition protein [Magnetospirillum sp. WYHS-4]